MFARTVAVALLLLTVPLATSATDAPAASPATPAPSPWTDGTLPEGSVAERALAAARIVLGPAAEVPAPAAPSRAVLDLLDRYETVPTPEQRAAVEDLDRLPEPTRTDLARVVAGFLALDARARLAREDPSVSVDAQRMALLEAADSLRPSVQAGHVNVVDVPPVVTIDAAGLSTLYRDDENYALLIDFGGNDRYQNNAGGTAMRPDLCTWAFYPAAALLDLGGHDQYGAPRTCLVGGGIGAVNGGGVEGSGLLFDAAGHDVYDNPGAAVNGGAFLDGTGLLYDLSGEDTYTAQGSGTNGGGHVGSGFLLDGDGHDVYQAGGHGSNGGSANVLGVEGRGALVDLSGDDVYLALDTGTNGGARDGAGLLVDLSGDDLYVAGDGGTNGGAVRGVGRLYDLSGDDTYQAGTWAVNGGAATASGLLFDGGGSDQYQDASSTCTNPTPCTAVVGTVGLRYDG